MSETTPTLTQLADALDEAINHHTSGKDDPLRIPRWKSERIAELVHGIACDWANIAIQTSGAHPDASTVNDQGAAGEPVEPPVSSDALKLAREVLGAIRRAPLWWSDSAIALAREAVRLHASLASSPPVPEAEALATNVMSPDGSSVLGKIVPPSAFAATASPDARRFWLVRFESGTDEVFDDEDEARGYAADFKNVTIVEVCPTSRASEAEKRMYAAERRVLELETMLLDAYSNGVKDGKAAGATGMGELEAIESAARFVRDTYDHIDDTVVGHEELQDAMSRLNDALRALPLNAAGEKP